MEVSYSHHALGRLLNSIKGYVGLEARKNIDDIIIKYDLMTPIVNSNISLGWKSKDSDQEFLEKIIGENTLRPIAFIRQAWVSSKSVAYIEVDKGQQKWSGTGFLLTNDLLITNNHVIPNQELLSKSIFRFNYQLDASGNPELSKDYHVKQGGIFRTNKDLDYTIVELDNKPGLEWGYLKTSRQVPIIDSRINIIQHPNGLPKQISLQNNFIKYVDNKVLQYLTSTMLGSSGSPVFNDAWEVVGIHHAGGWLPEGDDGPVRFRNEGIMWNVIAVDLPDNISSRILSS